MTDLRQAIIAANVSGPKGALDGPFQSYTISANDQITSAAQYKQPSSSPIATAPRWCCPTSPRSSMGSKTTRSAAGIRASPPSSSTCSASPAPTSSRRCSRVQRELPRLQAALPKDVKINLVHDRTETIRASIRDVQFTLVLAVVLVVLVVLLFLRSLRATIIAGVALPTSLIATFGVMWLAGFSLDNLSLMALTIGTGFVVDDAIVMIENIVRHIEDGEDPLTASLDGAREIGFTVISLTLSLIAVFIPLLFMTGLVGRMFREFALTLTIAVVVSAVVSLTLTPMMCARLLKGGKGARHEDKSDGFVLRFYGRSLEIVLRNQGLMLLVTLGTVFLTVWLYVVAPKGFLPLQDTGLITGVHRRRRRSLVRRDGAPAGDRRNDHPQGPGRRERRHRRRRLRDQSDTEPGPCQSHAEGSQRRARHGHAASSIG